MTMPKDVTLKRAMNETRLLEFTFRKDLSTRVVEVYDFYEDDKGNIKLWVWQREKDGERQVGTRVFFEEDVTYVQLLPDRFQERAMQVAPKKAFSV